MKSKLFTKPQLQKVLHDLRKTGYTVIKGNDMYKVFAYEGSVDPVLIATGHGYLVRYDPRLLTPAEA